MAINDIEQAYDTLPYTSQSFKESNPQKLEAIARLISLNPIPASKARVFRDRLFIWRKFDPICAKQ